MPSCWISVCESPPSQPSSRALALPLFLAESSNTKCGLNPDLFKSGTYPFCTSSNSSLGGAFTGTALPHSVPMEVIGVVKAYTTRVGAGPLPTETLEAGGHPDAVGVKLQEVGREWGVTTGRRRRCGWLDLVIVKYSVAVNDYTSLNLTKLDVLDGFEEIKVAVAYKIDGEMTDWFPADLERLGRAEIVYKTLLGWMTDTTGVSEWEGLPENARYVPVCHFVQGLWLDRGGCLRYNAGNTSSSSSGI